MFRLMPCLTKTGKCAQQKSASPWRHLSSVAMLLLLALTAACASSRGEKIVIEVHKVPVMSEPLILPSPTPPDLTAPPVQVETLDQARYYLDACEAWEEVGKPDSHTAAEVKELFPGIDLQSACFWAVYGWNTQNFITLEDILLIVSGYVETLRNQEKFYINQLWSRYRTIEEFGKQQEAAATDPFTE